MEFKISKQELMKGLSMTQSAVEKKSTMPILSNVLLKAENKNLKLMATDLEIGVICDHKAEVITPGSITVNAKTLYDIVRELPDSLVHIVKGKNDWLELNCGRSNFKVMGLSADEFPNLPENNDGTSYNLDASTILGMLSKVHFCMSTDENRYNLNGIYIEQPEGKKSTLRMVATDGHRLSLVDKIVEDEWKLPKGVIFPRKGVIELKNLLENC
jgi:DNA polymerase-3 subunit beta